MVETLPFHQGVVTGIACALWSSTFVISAGFEVKQMSCGLTYMLFKLTILFIVAAVNDTFV